MSSKLFKSLIELVVVGSIIAILLSGCSSSRSSSQAEVSSLITTNSTEITETAAVSTQPANATNSEATSTSSSITTAGTVGTPSSSTSEESSNATSKTTTSAATAKTTAATTAKPTTAATTKVTGTTAETTEQPANPNAGILDPTEPTPVPIGTYSTDMAQQVFALVNQARADAGYPALTWNDTLAAACDVRAKEIVTYFGHTRPDDTTFGTASDGLADGENIAKGRSLSTAQAVMNAWMASEGHKNNLLGVTYDYTITAITCYCMNGVYYWVEDFG